MFEIGSITKVFTTTLLADMHLKGEVHLDDPASEFLPASVVLRNRKGVDVTLRHLATHTSGLPRVPGNVGLKNIRSGNPYAKYTVEDMYEFLSKSRFVTAPGAMYTYSNLGMGLLGHIPSLVTEIGFEELVLERICRPLGMSDTAIGLSEDQLGRLAPGHARGKQVSNWDISTLAGCGAL
ncbi:MAG TPA: class A beta-lactamase-related serine hydrolase [Candidatus Hydrogenedentes bacterium]|nr:class A beta-lactamase-related serine hydrolase [Candidatus Hydrogenedentota bacterium]